MADTPPLRAVINPTATATIPIPRYIVVHLGYDASAEGLNLVIPRYLYYGGTWRASVGLNLKFYGPPLRRYRLGRCPRTT